jgi:hypothetical protein
VSPRRALSRSAARSPRRSFREYLKEQRFRNGEPIDEEFFKARISGRCVASLRLLYAHPDPIFAA